MSYSNSLSAFQNRLTMSSSESAESIGKNHADVLKDIRHILSEAEIDEGKFSGVYTGIYGHQFDKANILYPEIQGLTIVIDTHTKPLAVLHV